MANSTGESGQFGLLRERRFLPYFAAQALGDHRSLLTHGRRAIRVAVDDLDDIG